MPKFRITFKNGSQVELEAHTSDQAKTIAKETARRESGATEKRDTRVAVRSVEAIEE